MLKKLVKYEFAATVRSIPLIFVMILALSFGMRFAISGVETDSSFVSLISMLVIMAYCCAIVAAFVVLLLLTLNRFRNNLMSDEGYVMFTLPVSKHQIIWSKLFVSTAWFFATFLVIGLSGCIILFNTDVMRAFLAELHDAIQYISAMLGFDAVLFTLEGLLLVTITYIAGCLEFYSAMAIGYSFAKHKQGISVLAYFGLQFLSQFILGLLGNIFFIDHFEKMFEAFFYGLEGPAMLHFTLLGVSLFSLITAAIHYCITTYMLNHRLNLE